MGPLSLLFGLAGIATAALLALLVEHLRPHPEDLRRVNDRLTSIDLRARSIVRSYAVWNHYQDWSLSRFARFYRIEAEASDGKLQSLYAAFDPWRPQKGIQIL